MSEREHTWVALLVGGMCLTVVGITVLETAVWYLQYGTLLAGVVLAALSVYQQVAEPTSV